MDKKDILRQPIEHIDIKAFDSTRIIDSMRGMSFTARDAARAADILNKMIEDKDCTIMLCIAGSTSAGGCMQIYVDLVRHNMVDVIVATGATIVDMDFFEALGFRHYRGSSIADDKELRELYIDRIYDTYIDEEQLQVCDSTIKEIADACPLLVVTDGMHGARVYFEGRMRMVPAPAVIASRRGMGGGAAAATVVRVASSRLRRAPKCAASLA